MRTQQNGLATLTYGSLKYNLHVKKFEQMDRMEDNRTDENLKRKRL